MFYKKSGAVHTEILQQWSDQFEYASGPGADGGGIGGVGGQNSTGANGQPIPEESNLLTEFEFAYEEAVGTLIREDNVFDRSPETLQEELETKILKMSEVARKLETFFCQKRLLLHSHEPEYNLSDENQELKREILRKDELIRRHSDKLSQWQAMLSGQVQVWTLTQFFSVSFL